MQETSIFRAFIKGFHRMVYSTNKSVKVTHTGGKRTPRQGLQNDETLQCYAKGACVGKI